MSVRTGGISVLFFWAKRYFENKKKGGEKTFFYHHIYKQMLTFAIWGVNFTMVSKNITLKVKAELYDQYREHCRKEGWVVSRQFEKLMELHLAGREDNE